MELEERVARLEREVRSIRRRRRRHSSAVRVGLYKRKLEGLTLGRPLSYTQETATKVIELYHHGVSFRRISKEAGVSVGTAYSIVKKSLGEEYEQWNEAKKYVRIVSKLLSAERDLRILDGSPR